MQLEIHYSSREMLTITNAADDSISEEAQSLQEQFITLEQAIDKTFKIMNKGIFGILGILLAILLLFCIVQISKQFQM